MAITQYLGSLPFLIVGGIIVGLQIHAAFATSYVADRMGWIRTGKVMVQLLLLAIPFLALGGWFHPGNQWSAIGVTLLTAATLSMLMFMSHFVPDPEWRGGSIPDSSKLSWRIGFANLALIYAAGLALSWLGFTQPAGG